MGSWGGAVGSGESRGREFLAGWPLVSIYAVRGRARLSIRLVASGPFLPTVEGQIDLAGISPWSGPTTRTAPPVRFAVSTILLQADGRSPTRSETQRQPRVSGEIGRKADAKSARRAAMLEVVARTSDRMRKGQHPEMPAFSCHLTVRELRDRKNKWRGQDSNLRPRGYEPRELPGCSTPRCVR